MEGTTLQDINELGLQIKAERDFKDEHKKILEESNARLRELEAKFIFILQENGLERYSIPGYGTAYLSERLSYKVPKEPEARESFFRLLKERGVFEDMITVYSQTLNSWARKEKEVMGEECEIQDFEIPGLGKPTVSTILGVRKS